MDLEFSPSILDTPSLMTPNIGGTNPMIFKSSYLTNTMDMNNDDNNNNNATSSSNPSSSTPTPTTTTNDESLSTSSAEIKLSKIEHDLKQSFSQPREPTESPFQKMAKAGVLPSDKNVAIPSTTDDGIPVDIPSTAEVMNVLESFSKNLTKDSVEREITTTLISDNNRLDTSPIPPMGVNVSPKKKLLIRSQSHTEPTSPTSISINSFSQTQKINIDDENSNEDPQFQRLHDLPMINHTIDSNTHIDNNNIKPSYSNQTFIKQQPIIITTNNNNNNNNKRTYQQAVINTSIPKANSNIFPQNEVTSSGQLAGVKRQKTAPIQMNTINIRSSTNDNYTGGGDDPRKKQIRDSNREAARRCRERRRQYIEQLEGNLEQCKAQIKQLNEKLSRVERENTQLRAIITETKIFHPSTRLSSNESIVEFANAIGTSNGIDMNSETNDGNTLQRNYMNRNTH